MGNLAIGVVTTDMLRELFNTILANQVPDPANAPPVVNVNLDSAGKWRKRRVALGFRTRHMSVPAVCAVGRIAHAYATASMFFMLPGQPRRRCAPSRCRSSVTCLLATSRERHVGGLQTSL